MPQRGSASDFYPDICYDHSVEGWSKPAFSMEEHMSFSRTSIGSLDLNLLSALVVLVEEQSTVLAARRLHLAQSTVSGILAKLRDILDDELLVRNGRALEPTTKALELTQLIKPHIEALSSAVGASLNFSPGRDHREFRLGCTDAIAFSILPELTRNLRSEAPECDLIVRIGDYRTLPDMLSAGHITTAVGYLKESLSASARIRALRDAGWVVLRDPAQPQITGLDDFCARAQAIVTPKGDLSGFVDEQLEALGRKRRVIVGVSSFALLLAVLPGSDLISTVPDFIAERLAAIGQLAVDPCPLAIPVVSNVMAWSVVADKDPAQQWFRQKLMQAFVLSQ